MACPFFYPTGPFTSHTWLVPPRMPLVALQDGECRADCCAHRPSEDSLTRLCNIGYARGRCDRFPQNAESDAVRFSICNASPDSVEFIFVSEKGCRPIRHGRLSYAIESDSLVARPEDETLEQQALVFARQYLKRR